MDKRKEIRKFLWAIAFQGKVGLHYIYMLRWLGTFKNFEANEGIGNKYKMKEIWKVRSYDLAKIY